VDLARAKMADEANTKSNLRMPTARAAEQQALASQKLLSLLAVQILKVYSNKDLPPELKLLLTPLLIMVPVCSLVLVVFLGELAYCLVRSQEVVFLYYLVFLGTIAPTTCLLLLVYSSVASKFEASRLLESQLQSVTAIREPRNLRRARIVHE
jgi:hypothetical protein